MPQSHTADQPMAPRGRDTCINLFKYALYAQIRAISRGRCTVKPVLSGHSKIDKTKNLMTNGSLMEVEGIAECSPYILWTCIKRNRS